LQARLFKRFAGLARRASIKSSFDETGITNTTIIHH